MTGSKTVEALLFDMGGIVIDIDFDHALDAWSGCSRLGLDAIRERFSMDGAYRRHERGEIDAATYFDHLRASLELTGTDAEIERGWNAIFETEIDETLALVAAVRRRMPCYAFTNTNAAHQAHWSVAYPRVVAAFDRIFVSSEMGLRKPERAAFERVATDTGHAIARMQFFDDSVENVEGARAAGMHAVHVTEPADVERALRAIGAL